MRLRGRDSALDLDAADSESVLDGDVDRDLGGPDWSLLCCDMVDFDSAKSQTHRDKLAEFPKSELY